MSGVYSSGECEHHILGYAVVSILSFSQTMSFVHDMNQVNDNVCRVDFDEAWLRSFEDYASSEDGPYNDVSSVPNSVGKSLIRNIGRALFIEPFAVFPVSYLDNELIVFDFELLGTRICARKEKSET